MLNHTLSKSNVAEPKKIVNMQRYSILCSGEEGGITNTPSKAIGNTMGSLQARVTSPNTSIPLCIVSCI
jgi:hypothetical protein